MPENNKDLPAAKRILKKTGVVVSDKMDKTIAVKIDSVVRHSLYSKVIGSSIKVKVHDEKNTAKTGDTVEIVQSRPLSKNKRWRLSKILTKTFEEKR